MMKREWVWFGSIALIFSSAFIFSPITVAGQYVEIGWQVSGSGTQSGTIVTDLDWDDITQNPNTTYAWNLASPIDIYLGEEAGTAQIFGLSIGVKADPFIDFGFSARSANGATHFSFSSELLNVSPALTNPEGSAEALAYTLGGATILSGDFGGKIYSAEYNGGTFANLVSAPLMFGNEDITPQTIYDTVTSMQVHWGFTLSGGGQAAGLSTFTVSPGAVPEPATIALLGLGGLCLLRKRRA